MCSILGQLGLQISQKEEKVSTSDSLNEVGELGLVRELPKLRFI